ncbi:frizzled [Plakobranchus ocellatus]|uniref:Frizzled n=1 Tax=Plakobranchus ocellatus TaxID=259542 RepID=A0AAV4BRF0_9GAST|nr:frizzled [Plakobranchus ocellatus]
MLPPREQILFFLISALIALNIHGAAIGKQCAPVGETKCPHASGKLIHLPNVLGHTSLNEAETNMNQLNPVLSFIPSPAFKSFFCAVHFPQCTQEVAEGVILPCKSLCLQARADMRRMMGNQMPGGASIWPASIRCSIFPDTGPCMGLDGITAPTGRPTSMRNSSVINSTSSLGPDVKTVNEVQVHTDSVRSDDMGNPADLMTPFIKPMMNYMRSSTKLNQAQAKLARAQAEVAELTKVKLGLDIARLKAEQ